MAKDVDLFKAAMAHVIPLKGRRPASEVVSRPTAEGTTKVRDKPAVVATPAVKPVADRQPFDRDVDRALSRGRRMPQATLDLHGMTLAAAERAVARFLEESASLELRLVLIVTGKGTRLQDGRIIEGRIRAEFPGWLGRADNHARVHSMKAAHPRHGGGGAFYVLLRRRSASSSRSLRDTPQR
ncbi:MAG: Smr/MutS family protein [Alphaproteobacteria bacterium]|nr:Smr/MutS family protein [Alphaproteobacteria bacterium]